MAVRTTRTAADASAGAAEPGESRTVVGIKGRSRFVKKLLARNNDHVEPGPGLMAAKQLANDALGPIPLNGPPQLAGGGNSQSGGIEAVGPDEQRHEPPPEPNALLVDLLELGAAANPLAPRNAVRSRPHLPRPAPAG